MNNYVIVGNGTAAAGCIEGIRSADKSGNITVISEEKYPVYCRPLISYYLEGKTKFKNMPYKPDDFYETNNCNVIYGSVASKINMAGKVVETDDGKCYNYDKLCIATGSRPFVPPTEGLDTVREKFTFMTLDDALALEKSLSKDKNVLIVGAGLIGLKCAEGIYDRVKSLTVCDLADRILSSILDDELAAMMQKHLEDKGITFLLSDTVAKYDGNKAYMKSGKKLDFDILVTAVGVRANTELVKDIGGRVGRGITIDTHMKTSIDDIYAAGDCTECMDITSGTIKVLAILPNAYMQGFCAGQNMAGDKKEFSNSIPMNSIGFFGLHTMTAGTRFPEEQGGSVYEERDGSSVKKLFIKDDLLTGFMLIGDVERTGIYTSMIRNKTPLSQVDFERLKISPDLYSFGLNYRKEKLGGIV